MPEDVYVFDTNVLSEIRSYYPSRFPSLWKRLDELAAAGRVLSVREVSNELKRRPMPAWLTEWLKQYPAFFTTPNADETRFVAKIFAVPHFHALVERKALLRGEPAADPFVIAAAAVRGGCVVTQEHLKPNAAKIPNVCEHFGVAYLDLEGFMHAQGWTF